jgi:hypothetical protein
VHDVAFVEHPLALGGAQRGRTAEDDNQLLGVVVGVVDGEVAAPKLIGARAEDVAAWEALAESAIPRPVFRPDPTRR